MHQCASTRPNFHDVLKSVSYHLIVWNDKYLSSLTNFKKIAGRKLVDPSHKVRRGGKKSTLVFLINAHVLFLLGYFFKKKSLKMALLRKGCGSVAGCVRVCDTDHLSDHPWPPLVISAHPQPSLAFRIEFPKICGKKCDSYLKIPYA